MEPAFVGSRHRLTNVIVYGFLAAPTRSAWLEVDQVCEVSRRRASALVADAGESADRRCRHAAAGALRRVGLEGEVADSALAAVERALVDLPADLVRRDDGALEHDLRRRRIGRVLDDRLLAARPLDECDTRGLAVGAGAGPLGRHERRDGAGRGRAALAAHAVAERAGERVGER